MGIKYSPKFFAKFHRQYLRIVLPQGSNIQKFKLFSLEIFKMQYCDFSILESIVADLNVVQ